VVHLEDAKLRIRVPMSEGIEACAEKNILRNTPGNGAGKRVFGVATACHDEGAKGNGVGTVRPGGRATELLGIRGPENGDSDGIVEDQRPCIVELVRGATQGHAKCSSGWMGVLHDERR
jgi:hypothetical protein